MPHGLQLAGEFYSLPSAKTGQAASLLLLGRL